jgi:hypothetical protein
MSTVFGQGCVAVRNVNSCSLFENNEEGGMQVSLNYRYFRSFRHFRGKHEEKQRVEEGSEVINNDNSVVLGINYGLAKRWSMGFTLPMIYIDRSSQYEHAGTRHHTSSRGLGDIRLTGYYSPAIHSNVALNVGLGVKLPTGNYNYRDDFYLKAKSGADSVVNKPVDQSIQLGDGGLGWITEFDFAYRFNTKFQAYATGSYLFNPKNTNGTLRSRTLTADIEKSNEMSVADQFQFRAGGRFSPDGHLQIGLGGRYEGIPWKDVFGESDGFRRPGYIMSIEPSLGYVTGKHAFIINLPFAMERNRTRNTIDRARPGLDPRTGKRWQGDAAFADWLLSVSYAYKLK